MANFLDYFIPKNVVTAFVNATLKKDLVFGNLILMPRAGADIERGESYKVPSVGTITTDDYDGTDMLMQDVLDTGAVITIDQAKYFNIAVDQVDSEQQAKDLLPLFVEQAAYSLSNVQDAYIASILDSEATIDNTSIYGASTAIGIDESTVLDWISNVKTSFDDANVPQEGRFLVLPSFAQNAIAASNIVTASTTLEEARSKGFVTNFFGFNIYMSNNLVSSVVPSVGTVVKAIAGIQRSAACVQSVSALEFYKPEKRFGSAAKGLSVYGAKVLRADATASLAIVKA